MLYILAKVYKKTLDDWIDVPMSITWLYYDWAIYDISLDSYMRQMSTVV